jgi:hypothetical protein
MTTDKLLIKQLLLDDLSTATGAIELSQDCKITPLQAYQPSAGMVGVPEILEFGAVVVTNVGCNLLASWIYELIRHRGAKVELNGKEVSARDLDVQQMASLVEKETRDAGNTRKP